MIITRTPFRLSFFGGGTDYPEHFRKYGGAVLGTTVDKYCWLAVRPPTKFGPKFRVVYSKVDSCDKLDDIQHPAVRECLRHTNTPGAEIYHTSDLPARTGVGSSSAFVVGLLRALYALKGVSILPDTLARDAIKVEQEILKETVGSQDQILTAHGGFNLIHFHQAGDVWLDPNFRKYTLKNVNVVSELQKYLLLYYTGVQRTSSDVAATYVKDFSTKFLVLQRMREMVAEGASFLQEGDLEGFGRLLDEAWRLKQSLGAAVSSVKIDVLYNRAKEVGALGGKILGAGGGGFLLLFVPPKKQPCIREAFQHLTEVPFSFENEGSKVVFQG